MNIESSICLITSWGKSSLLYQYMLRETKRKYKTILLCQLHCSIIAQRPKNHFNTHCIAPMLLQYATYSSRCLRSILVLFTNVGESNLVSAVLRITCPLDILTKSFSKKLITLYAGVFPSPALFTFCNHWLNGTFGTPPRICAKLSMRPSQD